jgi:hypothetical protein
LICRSLLRTRWSLGIATRALPDLHGRL